ncbi:cell wall-binding repeat-containing protein [Clostridium sp. WILCCON 0269]|uniref:Cell wall-binding repeat-containing protein n=1 Tax=Candidatus Clostridium eludens TaxID=3381663 RepID=A0ABW8SNI4_9CLOT
MNKKRVLSIVLTFALAITTLSTNISLSAVRAASGEVTRTSGSDRYQTAAQVAVTNWTAPDNVVLVSGEGYADAISASVLAKKLDAPILLTTPKVLNLYTKTALDTLKPKNIYVIGGNASIYKEVRDSLKDSYNIIELGGANRYETNAAVAKKLVELGVDPSNAILVGGEGFSDALTVASIAAAKEQILLLGTNDLNYIKPVTDFINQYKSSITVVGTNFVINDDTYKAINGVKRINGGTDRFDTNLKVLDAFKGDIKTSKFYVANASGDGYADALVASVLAGKNEAPLVLLDNETSKSTANAIDYLKTNLTDSSEVEVLGGTGVIPENIVTKINGYISAGGSSSSGGSTTGSSSSGTSTTVQTFTGYIQDEDCFISYAPNYGDDTKMCLSMKSCAASGYGITALQSDGSYKFYYFDGNFATFADGKTFDGTGSQLSAWNLIQNTSKKDHVTITVTGTLKGDTKVSPNDGKSYPVITVSSLRESSSSSGSSGGSGSSGSSGNNVSDLNDGGNHSGDYTISTTGTFGPVDSDKATTVNGNVQIKYNASSTDSITLQDLNINGTLAVDFGEGNVTLNNVIVNGVKVANVGSNSLHVKGDTSIGSLIVNDSNDDAHIIIEGNAIITNTTINAGAKLEVASDATNAKPFENVTIASAAAANNVVLTGGFNNITVSSAGADLDLQESTVGTLLVSSEAKAAKIKTADKTTIDDLSVNAPISVTGNGRIANANLGVSGITVEKAPTNIAIVKGVTATVEGKTKDESNTTVIGEVLTTLPTLSSIEITAPAAKLNYIVRDKLDITGMQVTGTYSDNTTAVLPINKANVTGFNSSKAVDGQVLTITVGGKTVTYTINVVAAEQETITGYIEDVHCFFAYTDPSADTKGCLSMKSCAASGYGITVPQSDGTKKFYFFDGNFSTFTDGKTFDGTGSQLLAWNLIQGTTKKNNITVSVKGTLNGTEKTYTDKNGASYSFPVLTLSSLSETSTLNSIAITTPATKLTYSVGDALDITGLQVTGTYDDNTKVLQSVTAANVTGFDSSKPVTGQVLTITVGGKTTTYTIDVVAAAPEEQTFTGYIQDQDCFISYAPNYGDDTKMCLSMKSCAASGYGITALQSDGSYKFYYFDGNFATFADGKTFDGTGSQLSAWNLIQNTIKKNNITITVKGKLDGEIKTAPDGNTYPVITVTSLAEN